MEATNIFKMNPSSSCCLKKHMPSSLTSFNYRNSLKMGGFYDQGQLEYYKSSVRIRCGSDKKKMKNKGVKLLKGLSKDLNEFYGMRFGLDSQYYQQNQESVGGLDDQQSFKIMSEAAELLIEQLRKVKAEDKELKKKMKMEEKKKKKKKEKVEKRSAVSATCLESESSSSSSESSDSESDNEMVVDLKRLNRCLQLPEQQEAPPASVSIPTLQENGLNSDVSLLPKTAGEVTERQMGEESVISRLSIGLNQEKNRLGAEIGGMVGKKIEVCMGGKCKKSGAATLMDEFQRVVGFNDDVVVSGCKCMGKCREGPNVRVVNTPSFTAAPMMAATGNPLCLGVGVEDVGLIVSNFFGDESQQNASMGIPAAAM